MNVPRLRFKEFGENWEIKKLGDIAENLQSGKSKERNENGDFILYGSTGAIGFCNQFEHEGKNILIARVGANAGYLYEVDGNYCVSDNTLILHLKYPNNYSFFYNLLRHINLNKLVFGSGQPLITGGQLKVLNVFVPSFQEQTKIANFLTAVDEKIAQIMQKVELLARYKKGVMQQIFSQQLRFKDDDGQDFPEWEDESLGGVGAIITGKTPSTTNESLWNGDIQFVTPTDITEEKYQFKTQRTVENNANLKILPKNSIMFTCIASIGKMSLSVNPCITNQQINSLIPKSSFNNEYVYYALLSITEYIKSTQANTTLPIINKTEFSKFEIPVPSLHEQTKIANFLTALDRKISHNQNQLNALKSYKQGLLQQMFV
ncbi:MAG: restriction endonuclease subunit S [Methylococcaceae bacterium]|jgi:type I restriction enzyme S subunit